MINSLIRISYDGTNYSGFQVQANAPTIQEALERALELIYKQPVRIEGAGRTDSGVHARGQAASFRAPFQIPADKLPHALNALLPPDIVVTGAWEVPPEFHARFDARKKIYCYTIDRAAFPQVLKRLYSWHVPGELDLQAIKQAAELFEGTHDFRAFQAAGRPVDDTRRTLYRVEAVDFPLEQVLQLQFAGSGFLYRMVRLITGTLVRAGRGGLTPTQIESSLLEGTTAAAGPSAPPHGLCLEEVVYEL